MPAASIFILAIVGSLVILNLLAAGFGVDSRPIEPVRWI